MQGISLIISEAEIHDGNILITKMSIIDKNTGEVKKIAKITPELLKFLKSIEIDLTDYIYFIKMQDKNPALKKMVTSFNLILI